MTRSSCLFLISFVLIAAAPALAQTTEVLEIDPLADGDLINFKLEGEAEWKIDNVTDDVYPIIACSRPKTDTSILFRTRTFKHGFRLTIDVMGGAKNKDLEFFIVPIDKEERIQVPFKKRWLAKKGWHRLIVTHEDGKAWARVDDEKGEKIEVGEIECTFAITLGKRGEAAFKKPKIQYLAVSAAQVEPESGFVRIFDGKSLDGWEMFPKGVQNFKLEGEKIEAKVPMGQEGMGQMSYADGIFKDFVLRFSAAQGARNLILVGRLGTQDGSQRPVTASIESYFPGDKDWNEIQWTVKGRKVSLSVNGNPVWSQEAPNEQPLRVIFAVGRDGHAKLRDIRIKGDNLRPGASWGKYVAASGAAIGIGGGDSGDAPAGGGAAEAAPDEKVIFNGKDLDDWQTGGPADAWSVYEGRIVGMTLDMPRDAGIFYKKLVFTDYQFRFKLHNESRGVKILARAVPKAVAERAPVFFEVKPEWLSKEGEWTECVASVWGDNFRLEIGGKLVASGKVPKEQGFFGFHLDKNSSMALRDVVWQRPKPR